MTRRWTLVLIATMAAGVGAYGLASPSPARALGAIEPQCTNIGVPPVGGCSPLSGSGLISDTANALTAVTLAGVVAWVTDGARFVLHGTAQVIGQTTAPQLGTTWFSATYWRVAGIASVLTLPFLFAAALQALIRSDLSLLMRAALGYLPLALLAVALAAPLTMLLLAASDQMSSIVSSAASNQGANFLVRATGVLGGLTTAFSPPFVAFLIALLTVAGAVMLWMELLVRQAAVYVIVLMLPLAFAAFVWPARRIWAIRSVELLIALILSKFVIVAVLSLGGAALDGSANRSVTGLLAGGVLMALAACAPWALLRLIPFAEVASSAAASVTTGSQAALHRLQQSDAWASEGHHWLSKMAQMREAAAEAAGAPPPSPPPRDESPDRADRSMNPMRSADDRARPPADEPPGPNESARGPNEPAPGANESAPGPNEPAPGTNEPAPGPNTYWARLPSTSAMAVDDLPAGGIDISLDDVPSRHIDAPPPDPPARIP